MIGQQIGVGVSGTIVGVLRDLVDERKHVLLIEREPGSYIVATIRVDADGNPPEEWDNGRYGLSWEQAVDVMTRRVAYAVTDSRHA